MDDSAFLARLAAWERLPGSIDTEDYLASAFPEPLDARFDALCAIYLEASAAHRAFLIDLFASQQSTLARPHLAYLRFDNLILGYMRRITRRITTPDDTMPLRLGLAAGAIVQEHPDYRDVIVSLAFLHHAATRAGIDPRPHFEAVAALARPETGAFLLDFLTRSPARMKQMVREFGGLAER